jgi:hypothetical protein
LCPNKDLFIRIRLGGIDSPKTEILLPTDPQYLIKDNRESFILPSKKYISIPFEKFTQDQFRLRAFMEQPQEDIDEEGNPIKTSEYNLKISTAWISPTYIIKKFPVLKLVLDKDKIDAQNFKLEEFKQQQEGTLYENIGPSKALRYYEIRAPELSIRGNTIKAKKSYYSSKSNFSKQELLFINFYHSCYINVKYVLDLTNRAFDLFVSSETEEKRQLIKFVLQNLRLKDKTLLWDAQKPFDVITKFVR